MGMPLDHAEVFAEGLVALGITARAYSNGPGKLWSVRGIVKGRRFKINVPADLDLVLAYHNGDQAAGEVLAAQYEGRDPVEWDRERPDRT